MKDPAFPPLFQVGSRGDFIFVSASSDDFSLQQARSFLHLSLTTKRTAHPDLPPPCKLATTSLVIMLQMAAPALLCSTGGHLCDPDHGD